jgi:hypothetical protein
MLDCKTCRHATVLFGLSKDDRFSNSFSPSGFVQCAAPRYKGRKFILRDKRAVCAEYEKGSGNE